MFATLRRDVRAVKERDPAARSVLEIIFCYPGVHAVWGHRGSRWLWDRGHRLPARVISTVTRWLTGADIHPGATLGPGLFIDHANGVVIGETAEVGVDVTIYHGVTLGGTSLEQGKRHPTVGDRVTVGAGAKILGSIAVGDGCRIGANAVVVKSVPPNSVVVGVPGQAIVRSRSRPRSAPLDLDDGVVPDPVGISLTSLLARVERLESKADGRLAPAGVRPTEAGTWRGEDFSI
jgi:serine O-acetyltransferase